jgi:signal transduction histidine kinase
LPPPETAVHVTVVDAVPIRRTPTELRALLRSCRDILQPQARAVDVTLSVTADDRLPREVSLDADKIGWATMTLVGNALRYVRHGSMFNPAGSIIVRATYDAAAGEVTIEVQDDGPGIPPDTLDTLFRAGSDQARVALGVRMVREVVAAHGGRVEAHSETAAFLSGTTIRLTLPVG